LVVVDPAELPVIPATLLPVHPDNVMLTVMVCLAAVSLTPGEIVALPVTLHEMAGFGAFAASAEPDPTTTLNGMAAATINMTVVSRGFTKSIPVVF